jgi:hypothetical protein
LRRFAVIATIALVVLTLGVGPAFASVCTAVACGPAMACPQAASPACPMKTGAPVARGACGHPMDHGSRDVVSSTPTPDRGLAVAPIPGLVVPAVAVLSSGAFPLADARGAPHMTAVLRL